MRYCFIAHMGVADHLNQVGLLRYLVSEAEPDDSFVYLEKGTCKALVTCLYKDEPAITVLSDSVFETDQIWDTAFLKERTGCDEVIHLGYNAISRIYGGDTGKSFIDCLYEQIGVAPQTRYVLFQIPPFVYPLARTVYERFCSEHGSRYRLVHEDPSLWTNPADAPRGHATPLSIPENPASPCINLNGLSSTMIDYVEVLAHAEEIYLIDSAWATLLWLATFHDERLQRIPVTLSVNARSVKNEFLYDPCHPNWKLT